MPIIIGAKGHAKEILDVLEKNGDSFDDIFFYDDISKNIDEKLYSKYTIIKSFNELMSLDIKDKDFILGIGNPSLRFSFAKRLKKVGWNLISIVSKDSIIGEHNVTLECGLNIMHNVFISNDVIIREGSLINTGSQIHHDVYIGKYCEVSPKVCITGKVIIDDFSSIGTGALIIPNVKVGKNCIIGAGSVVTKDIPNNSVAFGVPAKVIKEIEPLNE